ncbi:carboxypeptidase-like regulatory domain-containing protein [Ohtaekwangia koreensis]|uniref:CarboxypepD_reg-like domain-containing protein n=1 Tax=Ohtaekwangia koreensis TaxID=688867 RepID=A0A1T5LBJ1_9BACT|nr:carboxypeptidase-like regulatory domain-containing protein [Ohtaekwangia koreensis]SKC72758.1 CarboxypepD_reg-like domain-containing protein [Ohtaekwangia koreensis]
MKKSITLSVPKPCNERWENFTPTTRGGFCKGCQKEVIDFTAWSDDALQKYIFKQGRIPCGRFNPSQLKVYTADEPRYAVYTWLPVSMLSAMLLVSPAVAAQSQEPTAHVNDSVSNSNSRHTRSLRKDKARVTIKGVVHDQYANEPLPGVSIYIKGSTTGTVTNDHGEFSLTFPHLRNDTLIASFIGYETQELPLNSVAIRDSIMFNLQMDVTVLGGPELYFTNRWTPRSIWWKIKNLFR